jgi:hypothetical protein
MRMARRVAAYASPQVVGCPTTVADLPFAEYDTAFYARLETWAGYFVNHTPSHWLTPLGFWGYGAYVNKPGQHGLGRALDLSRIYVTQYGASSLACSARYDQWRGTTGEAASQRRYWATAASLFRHFQYVLTYHHDTLHWNHLHVDTEVSGNQDSVFSSASTTQVKFVQSALRYVWGYSVVSIDGAYGPQTRDYASRALDRSGSAGAVTTFANWQRFCETTLRFGTGRSTY